jgi:hypothetical protein
LALDGVPKNVATPVPREVIPVPPFATGKVPVTPVVKGSPVVFVKVPEAGVPKAGVVKVGEVKVLFVSVWVPVSVATVESIAIVPDPVIVPPVMAAAAGLTGV